MSPLVVAAALVGVIALATVIGLVLRSQQGRIRPVDAGTHALIGIAAATHGTPPLAIPLVPSRADAAADGPGDVISAADLPEPLGADVTVVQFSSEWCTSCVATARLVDGLRGELPGLRRIELDVDAHPELVRRFRVLQTPTLLLLDRAGAVRSRIGGAPRLAPLRTELDRIIGSPA
ncbi:thioredoxin family protein [Schumannella soli]|uniref:Thioredoxin family protein n=1 Tax=Schumannella soli TaxID=2590779 RepID=A0A506Y9D1_9MICO|nr:thioredoxin family protein [Schumannella soli]TPW77678.1 thioredoxin family protein [Schumannella soli]